MEKRLWMVTVGEWWEGESSVIVFDDEGKAGRFLHEAPEDPYLHKTMYGPFGIGEDAYLTGSVTEEFLPKAPPVPEAGVPGTTNAASFCGSVVYRFR